MRMQARSSRCTSTRRSIEYSVRLVAATRAPGRVGLGDLDALRHLRRQPARVDRPASSAARALAFLRGRDYVLPHDVAELALDVLRHRLVLSYEALADDVDPDTVIARGAGRAVPCARGRAAEAADDGHRPRPAAAPAGVAGDPPPRRAAAGRLPHAVPRLRASTSPACASTSRTTTRGTSTGTRPPGWTSRRCGSTPRTASSPPGWCSTGRRRWRVGAPGRGKHDVLSRARARAWPGCSAAGGNRVGAMLYDGATARIVPPGTGRAHALRIGHELDRRAAAPVGGHHRLRRDARRRRVAGAAPVLVIVVSDFIGTGDWDKPLLRLAHRHEVVALRVRRRGRRRPARGRADRGRGRRDR